jgi:hypothetical protein
LHGKLVVRIYVDLVSLVEERAMHNDVHVLPDQGKWKVSGLNEQFETQAEAEEAGRKLAKQQCAEFVLHGEDGQIRAKDSYGNDPRNIPG